MKKIVIGILAGASAGLLLMLFIIYIGVSQAAAQNPHPPTESEIFKSESTQTEAATEPDESEELKFPTETELPTEIELPTESELPTETEFPDEPEPEPEPEQPKEVKYRIMVNRAANCVTIYTKDEMGNYTVPYKSMICSVGTYYWNSATQSVKGRTPLGTYTMPGEKYRWRKLFGPQGMDVYGYYTTRIVGHILFHSVPYTQTSNNTLWEGQYNMLGSPASKGCIRLSVEDAKWIYDNCGKGTQVEIYDDASNPGPLGRPEAVVIGENSPYAGWDPTDQDKDNPWHTGKVVLEGVKNLSAIERGANLDLESYLLGGVTATDVDGLQIPVTISTTLDVNQTGTYTVTYTATGVTGKSATADILVKVTDTTAPYIVQTSTKVITINSTDIEKTILQGLELWDNGEKLDVSGIRLDLSALYQAMEQGKSQTVMCPATAKDAYGNTASPCKVLVVYRQEADRIPPQICLTNEMPYANVELIEMGAEEARREAIATAAATAVIRGKHYTVTDNASKDSEIECEVLGKYTGETTAGVYKVELVITAKDASGNSSTQTIWVEVMVTS